MSEKLTSNEIVTIRTQLDKILQSSQFRQAEKQARFLKYIVEAKLSGDSKNLNQFSIGIDVFDKDETYDPAVDSTVRVEAGRLRFKLQDYYQESGKDDSIIIELPKGGYAIRISKKQEIEDKNDTEFGRDNNNYSESITSDSKWIIPISSTSIIISLLVILAIYGLYSFFPRSSSVNEKNITSKIDQNNQGKFILLNEKPAIAVLPFNNMSNDPSQEYFSDGITEDIITDLSKISWLFVISRHSTFVYKNKIKNISEISNELGARYILEGSVRNADDKMRITAQLIDAKTDTHLWADRYDREYGDIFTVQDDVTRSIVNALKVTLTDFEERRIGHIGTNDIKAHDYLLKGQRQFYQFNSEGIENALDLFSKSIEADKNYAEAYAWKSRAVVYMYITGLNNSIEDTVDQGINLAKRSIELDELLPIAHANLGWAYRWREQYDEALYEIDEAIKLDPNYADSYLWQSIILSVINRGDEALKSIEKAIQINPNYSVTYIFALGLAHYSRGDHITALEYHNRGIIRNKNFIPNHIFKIAILDILGESEQAESARNVLLAINPDYKTTAAYLSSPLSQDKN